MWPALIIDNLAIFSKPRDSGVLLWWNSDTVTTFGSLTEEDSIPCSLIGQGCWILCSHWPAVPLRSLYTITGMVSVMTSQLWGLAASMLASDWSKGGCRVYLAMSSPPTIMKKMKMKCQGWFRNAEHLCLCLQYPLTTERLICYSLAIASQS